MRWFHLIDSAARGRGDRVRRAPTHGPNGGVADSLDEAKAPFRAGWERPAPCPRAFFSVIVARYSDDLHPIQDG
jgi:hypothetical protein